MEINKIVEKSTSGAKWSVILSVTALPLGVVTYVILGRISPEALGVYGLVSIFYAFITTFILFGGSNVIVRYLPGLGSKQWSFLMSYTIIVFAIAIPIVAVMSVFPQTFAFIFGQVASTTLLSYFFLFIPVVLLFAIFTYALNGLMEIKTSALVGQATTYVTFVVLVTLFFLYRDFLHEHYVLVILGLFFALYGVLGLLALVLTARTIEKQTLRDAKDRAALSFRVRRFLGFTPEKSARFKPFVPNKFWSFALFVDLATILLFAYEKLDQLIILALFGISALGSYYAALQIALLIRLAPLLVGGVLLATFSHLLVSNEAELIQTAYSKLIRYNTLMIVPIALFCVFFSRQIMGVFGQNYINSQSVLVVLAICFMPSSIGTVNPSLILAHGKGGVFLLNSTIQIAAQIAIMLLLVNRLGVLGLAIGRGVGLLIAQTGLILIANRLEIHVKIPRPFFASVLVAIIALVAFIASQANILALIFSFLACLVLFLYLGSYKREDVLFLTRQLRGQLK